MPLGNAGVVAADLAGIDAPAWISAISSAVSLIVAGIAGWAALRVYRIEKSRDSVALADRLGREQAERRDQASRVSAWWGRQAEAGAIGTPCWGVYARNASETPIYQAFLNVVDPLNADLVHSTAVAVLPPTTGAAFHPVPAATPAGTTDGDLDDPSRLRVVFAFADAAEVTWIRDQRGRLHESRDSLTVFADIYRSGVLTPILEQFGHSHGVDIDIQTVPWGNLQTEFLAAAASGRSPDLLVGAHDWVGNLVRRGTVAPIDIGDATATFADVAVRAMSHRGRLYGIPYAIECLALIRNTALAPAAPRTIEDMIETGRRLIRDGRVTEILALPVGATGNAFHIYPFFSAGGGYLFGRGENGVADLTDVGLDRAEAIDSFHRIQQLGRHGVIKADMRSRQATALFKAGQAPFLIAGPWAVTDLATAGVPFSVSALPGYADGTGTAQSLVGVQGFFLGSAGRNRAVARELLTTGLAGPNAARRLFEADRRPPALMTVRAAAERDPTVRGFLDNAEAGQIMPALPCMTQVWRLFERAEVAVLRGDPVAPALAAAARDIRDVVGSDGAFPGDD